MAYGLRKHKQVKLSIILKKRSKLGGGGLLRLAMRLMKQLGQRIGEVFHTHQSTKRAKTI